MLSEDELRCKTSPGPHSPYALWRRETWRKPKKVSDESQDLRIGGRVGLWRARDGAEGLRRGANGGRPNSAPGR